MGSASGSLTRRPGLVLAALTWSALCYSLLTSLVVPVLPDIGRATGASPEQTAWLFSGFLLAAGVATPPIGRLGDRLGRRRVLLAVLAVIAAGTLLAAVSDSFGVLVVARFMQGAGGGVIPLAIGMLRTALPSHWVTTGVGTLNATLGVGSAAGIVLGGLLIEHMPYQALFWMLLAATLGSLLSCWLVLPRDAPDQRGAPLAWGAAALMAIGSVGVLLGISNGGAQGWAAPATLLPVVAGLAVLALWLAVELRARTWFIDVRLMRLPAVGAGHSAAFLVGVAMYSGYMLLPSMLQVGTVDRPAMSASSAVVFLLPWAVAQFVVSPFTGVLQQRIGSIGLIGGGSALCALASTVFAIPGVPTGLLLLASAAMGAGNGLALSGAATRVLGAVAQQQVGEVMGVNAVLRLLGGALGTQVAASLIAGDGGAYPAAFAVGAVAAAAAVVVTFTWTSGPTGELANATR